MGDIRRDTDINHPINYPTEYTLGSNSGFLLVKEYGKACQFNNIPEMIESGVYYNARINSERAKEYWNKRKKAGPADTKKNEDGSDSEWVECWYKPQDKQGNTLSLDPKSCYKSTLITPMTLWYNDLDISFKRLMAVRGESIERLILGYLCIDHVQENYFKRKDEDIGYIFADILSLYQFVRLIYTKYSPYFSASYTLLKKQRAPGSVKTKKT